MDSRNRLTEGPLFPALVKFSIPLLLSLLLQAMYGAVDLLVVGRFGDASGVSAVSTGSQIIQMITGIITGLTMGPTILVGHHMGAGDEKGAAGAVGTAICLFAGFALAMTALMLAVVNPFVALMQAPPEAVMGTRQYVFTCSLGILFIVSYNAISAIMRGLGNSKLPLVFVLIACVVNIVGDLILVGLFGLGALGAAIATVAAQGVSVVLSVLIIARQGLGFPFTRADIRFNRGTALRILGLGSPIALQNALTSVSFLVITGILNSMGLIASAGVGVAEKCVAFVMLIPSAYMSTVSAFTAQNLGAGKTDRAYRSWGYGMGISLCFGITMFLLSFFRGDLLTGIFTTDPLVIAAASDYLKSYAIDCVLVCIFFCTMGFFNGCGKTVFVMVQGVAAAFLVRIPFSYFVSRIPGASMFHIGLATPLATVFSILLCAAYFLMVVRKAFPYRREEPSSSGAL